MVWEVQPIWIAANDAMTQLKQRYGMRVVAPIVGTLMSALEMPGFSLSLLPATEALLQHLYAPTNGMYQERERERERERDSDHADRYRRVPQM
jgi:dihydroxyacetone kinase